MVDASSVLPDWLPTSRGDFQDLVYSIIVEWLVGGIIEMLNIVGGALMQVVSEFLGAFRSAGSVVVAPFAAGASGVLSMISALDAALADMAAGLGPFSPLIVIVAFGVVLVISFGVARIGLEVIKWVT